MEKLAVNNHYAAWIKRTAARHCAVCAGWYDSAHPQRHLTMTHPQFATPEAAEKAFYCAFESSDLNAMMAVWADRDCIECIHPMSDRARGRNAVAESWRRIFDGGLRVRLCLTDVHRTQDALLAVHVVYEHLRTPDDIRQYPPVIATNIYQLINNSWHMVLHHASPTQDESSPDTTALSEDPQRLH
jgi:ketosteroid isomerase-like protein